MRIFLLNTIEIINEMIYNNYISVFYRKRSCYIWVLLKQL